MPIVTIQITREGVTSEQKAALIKGATDLLAEVLDKPRGLTFVVIEEVDMENSGVIGQPNRPVSVMHFHGTKDEYIPFKGGRGAKSIFGTNYRPVEESIRVWVTANGCDETPTTDVLSEGGDGLRVTRRTHGSGRDGSEVVLVVIEGGGHTWPGKKPAAAVLGRSTLNVSANDLMWEFFQKHQLK